MGLSLKRLFFCAFVTTICVLKVCKMQIHLWLSLQPLQLKGLTRMRDQPTHLVGVHLSFHLTSWLCLLLHWTGTGAERVRRPGEVQDGHALPPNGDMVDGETLELRMQNSGCRLYLAHRKHHFPPKAENDDKEQREHFQPSLKVMFKAPGRARKKRPP